MSIIAQLSPQGIPADDIFTDDYNVEDDMMDAMVGGYHDNQAGGEGEGEEDDDIVQIRKRRRVEEGGSDGVAGGEQGTCYMYNRR